MSMEQSIELGWLITRTGYAGNSYSEPERLFMAIDKDFPDADDIGYEIPGTGVSCVDSVPGDTECVCLETHPHDETIVFVSNGCLEHGSTDFTAPVGVGCLVRQFIKKYDPEAVVTWGVIETRR
jgi:hypothetical protein